MLFFIHCPALIEIISKELFKENYEYRIIKTAKLDELVDKKKNYEIVIIDLDDTSYPGNSIAKELYFFNKEIIIESDLQAKINGECTFICTMLTNFLKNNCQDNNFYINECL